MLVTPMKWSSRQQGSMAVADGAARRDCEAVERKSASLASVQLKREREGE